MLWPSAKSTAQLYIGIQAAPAVQTIYFQEATITSGYGAALLPQASLRLRYDVGQGLGFTLSGGWFAKGALVTLPPDSSNHFVPQSAVLESDYFAVGAGVEYRIPVAQRMQFLGRLEVIYGHLHHAHRKSRGVSTPLPYFFTTHYAGLDIAIALQYTWPSRMNLRFAPALEIQANHAYHSAFFLTKYLGFAPRVELYIPLVRRKDQDSGAKETIQEPR